MHHTIWEWRLYDASYYMGVEAVRCVVLYGSGGCKVMRIGQEYLEERFSGKCMA